jgi:hypothetical protein
MADTSFVRSESWFPQPCVTARFVKVFRLPRADKLWLGSNRGFPIRRRRSDVGKFRVTWDIVDVLAVSLIRQVFKNQPVSVPQQFHTIF